MEYIYSWIKNIVIYLIVISIIMNLIQSESYKKYIKFFSGLIMILLVIQPLIKLLDMDEKLSYYLNTQIYKIESQKPVIDFMEFENLQNDYIFSEYKDGLKEQIAKFAADEKLFIVAADIQIIEDETDGDYGRISHIDLILSTRNPANNMSIQKVEKVTIDGIANDNKKNDENNNNNEKIEDIYKINIKKAISDFYNISENNININIQE